MDRCGVPSAPLDVGQNTRVGQQQHACGVAALACGDHARWPVEGRQGGNSGGMAMVRGLPAFRVHGGGRGQFRSKYKNGGLSTSEAKDSAFGLLRSSIGARARGARRTTPWQGCARFRLGQDQGAALGCAGRARACRHLAKPRLQHTAARLGTGIRRQPGTLMDDSLAAATHDSDGGLQVTGLRIGSLQKRMDRVVLGVH